MAPRGYRPELTDVDRQARYELEQIQGRVSAASFTAARERFSTKREKIEAQINASQIDSEGRTNCLQHVSAFYDAVNATTDRERSAAE